MGFTDVEHPILVIEYHWELDSKPPKNSIYHSLFLSHDGYRTKDAEANTIFFIRVF
jgi:hypothetical protein